MITVVQDRSGILWNQKSITFYKNSPPDTRESELTPVRNLNILLAFFLRLFLNLELLISNYLVGRIS